MKQEVDNKKIKDKFIKDLSDLEFQTKKKIVSIIDREELKKLRQES